MGLQEWVRGVGADGAVGARGPRTRGSASHEPQHTHLADGGHEDGELGPQAHGHGADGV